MVRWTTSKAYLGMPMEEGISQPRTRLSLVVSWEEWCSLPVSCLYCILDAYNAIANSHTTQSQQESWLSSSKSENGIAFVVAKKHFWLFMLLLRMIAAATIITPLPLPQTTVIAGHRHRCRVEKSISLLLFLHISIKSAEILRNNRRHTRRMRSRSMIPRDINNSSSNGNSSTTTSNICVPLRLSRLTVVICTN